MPKPTDEEIKAAHTGKKTVLVGTKFDKGKPDWDILPWPVVTYLADLRCFRDCSYSLVKTLSKEVLRDVFLTLVRNEYEGHLWAALLDVVHVLEGGAIIHGRDNWKDVPDAQRRYCNAFYRHLAAGSSERDSNTGLPHISHALCNLIFLIHFAMEMESHEGK